MLLPSVRQAFAAYALWAACASAVVMTPYATTNATTNSTKPKVIMDNDWSSAGFIPFLLAISQGWDLLGLASDTANSWALQTGLHALATLEVGNLSCIPVYRGASWPLFQTPKLVQAWEHVHGDFVWQGVFARQNLTLEAEGNDPTGGDPDTVVKAAFLEGYPNTTFAEGSAAEFMVQQVRKYPGEVSIFAAGSMTNVALAVRMDPTFARNAKQLVVQGGYLDNNLYQATGSLDEVDINTDFNLIADPEAAKIAFTADFPKIILAGDVTNQIIETHEFFDSLYNEVQNNYTYLAKEYAFFDFPFWDETAAAIMLDPSIVTNKTHFYVDVDTSWSSPSYGLIHAYKKSLSPAAQKLREVESPLTVDAAKFKDMVRKAMHVPQICG